ncbi:MAG TPA: S-methyl-5'-thioadenosine phosphorylase [Lentisphaeria bacterium]|nr:MAG: methylthioadenosine phosphorylase [Lentisphaerae bacterium GWF2_38_69]HBM16559.1 S-methyl-5'-thioadenosine phosphorylase [Lentisphaeria bacterium]
MKLGVIGGSGLYSIEGLQIKEKIPLQTPFGKPSDAYLSGSIAGLEVVFLPRHGEGHTISPSEINHRANIYGMKKLGVTHILSFSAVGSLQGHFPPKDIVIIDQYFDRTKQSENHTFFRNGIAAHIPFGDPICPEFKNLIFKEAQKAVAAIYGTGEGKPKAVNGGTYVNMEGPAFSTKAESKYYKACGFDLIGMTSLAEAKLSREAEICYSAVAMVTDFDCWHSDHDSVTVDMVVETMKSNIRTAKEILSNAVKVFKTLTRNCPCPHALKGAIMTSKDKITPEIKSRLDIIAGKYF